MKKDKPYRGILNKLEWAIFIVLALALICIIAVIILICCDVDNVASPLIGAISTALLTCLSLIIAVGTYKFEYLKRLDGRGIPDLRLINSLNECYFGIKLSNVGTQSSMKLVSIELGTFINGAFTSKKLINDDNFRGFLLNILECKEDDLYTSTFDQRTIMPNTHIWIFKVSINKKEEYEITVDNYNKIKDKFAAWIQKNNINCVKIIVKPIGTFDSYTKEHFFTIDNNL